jgi:hypothetical protein
MSNETIKNYGKSIRSKLLNISQKEDVFHQTILTRFFQERLLYRMSQTNIILGCCDIHTRCFTPLLGDSGT